jgi:arginine deiminase
MPTRVFSDVDRLKKVILHRPGRELLNLSPKYLSIQLFDDIPWLEAAQREHDYFVQVLKGQGVEVRYIEEMLSEAIACKTLREELTSAFLLEAVGKKDECAKKKNCDSCLDYVTDFLKDYFSSLAARDLIDTMIGGLRKEGLKLTGNGRHFGGEDYPFLLDPMPNMYFTRDPFAFIGTGVSVNSMYMRARRRESLFGDFLLKHHPEFEGVTRYYSRDYAESVEGGDIIVLSENALCVGVSERTSFEGVKRLAENIFGTADKTAAGQTLRLPPLTSNLFEKVLAVHIPAQRSYMHLDTVMTMVDRKKFVIHKEAVWDVNVTVFEMRGDRLSERVLPLDSALKDALGAGKIEYIHCGGESLIDAAREQWNDGANTVALAPGEIIVYDRNPITNRLLVDGGVKIHEIPCAELVRGRGGPHCMTMPYFRVGQGTISEPEA